MINFYFPGNYISFKSSLYLTKKDKEVIKENDRKLTNVGDKKISVGNLAITTGAGAIAGQQSGKLVNQFKQKKAGVKMTGKGAKAKLIGTAVGAGLAGGLNYYLQTKDRDGRSDKGKKRSKFSFSDIEVNFGRGKDKKKRKSF